MKRSLFKVFATLFFAIFATSVYAQTGWPEQEFIIECLGKHCDVSVDLYNDPVESGYLKYTIPTPTENIDYITGPAGSYLSNHLGNTVDVYVRRSHLELALADSLYAQVVFRLYVRLWKSQTGDTKTYPESGYNQCFYHVVFNMRNL
jgi:hypothetical protein